MLISYLRIDRKINLSHLNHIKAQLPEGLASKNDRLVRLEDRQRNLFGILLLEKLWIELLGVRPDLQRLNYTKYKRPFIEGSTVDFNISHAGDFVICVVSPNTRVGIDIELKKEVNLKDFNRTMGTEQWEIINKAQNPIDTFFKFWCMKESVIKADGRGLSIPLNEIVFNQGCVQYGGNQWYLSTFQLDSNHGGCLASNELSGKLEIKEIPLESVIMDLSKRK